MQHIKVGSSQGVMALSSIKGVGPATIEKLVTKFATFDDLLGAGFDDVRGASNSKLAPILADENLIRAELAKAEIAIAKAADGDVAVYSSFEGNYPIRARDIDAPPQLIYVAGDVSVCDRSVGCVGSRQPSHYGQQVTKRIVAKFAEEGWNVVSGLAEGVDRIGHIAAIESGIKTAAVVACGLDAFSNNRSLHLANRILDEGGCVISEQPFGREEDSGTLVRRNRLITALSVGTVVMQCMVMSGTMHSVRYAVSQGRPLFAPVPSGRYAEEPEAEGVLAVTSLSGPHLAQRIALKDAVRERFEREFAESPVVFGIRSKDDYDFVISKLEDRYKEFLPRVEPIPANYR